MKLQRLDFKTTVCLYLCFSVCVILAHAQSTAIAKTSSSFDALVGTENSGLYVGPQFKDDQRDAWDGSHIYLESPNYAVGNLIYKDQPYFDVYLKYDLVDDQVSIESPDYLPIFRIKLIAEDISSFTVHDRQFIHLRDQTIHPSAGFFEKAYMGTNLSLYIKHRKRRKRETVDRVLQYRFINDNYYLLQVGDTSYTILSFRDLKNVFPDEYPDLRNLKRKNKRMAKNQPDAFMIKLATYLDEALNHEQ